MHARRTLLMRLVVARMLVVALALPITLTVIQRKRQLLLVVAPVVARRHCVNVAMQSLLLPLMFVLRVVNKCVVPTTFVTRLALASSISVKLAQAMDSVLLEFVHEANVAVLLVDLAQLAMALVRVFQLVHRQLVARQQWAIVLAQLVVQECWLAILATIACNSVPIRFDCVDQQRLAQNLISARHRMLIRSVQRIQAVLRNQSSQAVMLVAKIQANVFHWIRL